MHRNRKEEDVGFIQWDSLEYSVVEGGWGWLFQRHWGAPYVGHSHSVHLTGAQVRDTNRMRHLQKFTGAVDDTGMEVQHGQADLH